LATMNRTQIIESIAKDPEYRKACRQIAKDSYLADELFQELMIILLEYDENKIVLIWNEKRIKWFVISILLKMCHSKTSPFYKKIRKFSDCSNELTVFDIQDENINHAQEIPDIFQMVECTDNILLTTENGYEKVLLKMSVELGSVQKVSQSLGIPYLSVWISINNYKKKIKSQYGKV